MTSDLRPPSFDGTVVTVFGRDTLRFSRHRILYRHWLTCAGPAAYPDRKFIALDRIPEQVLPYLEIVRLDDAGEPVAEYAGEKIAEITGIDFKGQRFVDVGGGLGPAERMKWCFRFGVPYIASANLQWGDRRSNMFSALVLPFGGSAGNVERLAVGLEFSSAAVGPKADASGFDAHPPSNGDRPTQLEQV